MLGDVLGAPAHEHEVEDLALPRRQRREQRGQRLQREHGLMRVDGLQSALVLHHPRKVRGRVGRTAAVGAGVRRLTGPDARQQPPNSVRLEVVAAV